MNEVYTMTIEKRKRISILGAGKIGLALATLWLRAGHSICLGSRNPEKLQSVVDNLGLRVSIKYIGDAAASGEIIVLAVPYSAVNDLTSQIKNEVKNKIIIDATNPFGLSPEGHVISTLGLNTTAGTYMTSLLPNSTIIRGFTHIMDELLVSRGRKQPGLFAIAIAGDDPAAKSIVADLVSDTGFIPVDIGTLLESAPLDPGGVLFPQLLTAADMKWKLNRNLER
jgi:predicted dinucleotide-binding enzyme